MLDVATTKKIIEIAKKHGLMLVVLFGSQATGRLHKESDIDIAVLPKESDTVSRVVEDIGNAFGRNDVEVADLSKPSPYLWRAVAKDGILLFESRDGFFSEWKLQAMTLWYDTAPLRLLQKAALRSWATAQQK